MCLHKKFRTGIGFFFSRFQSGIHARKTWLEIELRLYRCWYYASYCPPHPPARPWRNSTAAVRPYRIRQREKAICVFCLFNLNVPYRSECECGRETTFTTQQGFTEPFLKVSAFLNRTQTSTRHFDRGTRPQCLALCLCIPRPHFLKNSTDLLWACPEQLNIICHNFITTFENKSQC